MRPRGRSWLLNSSLRSDTESEIPMVEINSEKCRKNHRVISYTSVLAPSPRNKWVIPEDKFSVQYQDVDIKATEVYSSIRS